MLIGLTVFTIGPVLASFYLSFTNWELGELPVFIGLENYSELFMSPVFLQVLKNTVLYLLLYVPLCVALSLALAMLVNKKIRSISLFRTAFFLPVVTSMVAAALVWGWMFHPDIGWLNFALAAVGINGPRWLEDPDWALFALSIVSIWKNAGYNMMILLAGLASLPKDQYEAAALDGASPWRRFMRITLPLLSPILFFVTVITTIGAFQVFEQTYVLTKGGPSNSTLTLSYYVWQTAFEFFNMGLASAAAYILFALLMLLTAMQFWMRKRWVYTS